MSRRAPHTAGWLLGLCLLVAGSGRGAAEVGSDGPVRPSGGPLSSISKSVRSGSGPVTNSVGSGRNAGPLSGNPVSGSGIGPVRSGAVSDASVGAVTDDILDTPQAPIGMIPSADDSAEEPALAAPVFNLRPLAQQLLRVQPLPAAEEMDAAALPAEDEGVAPADPIAVDGATAEGPPVDEAVPVLDDESVDESQAAAEPDSEATQAELEDTAVEAEDSSGAEDSDPAAAPDSAVAADQP